MIELALSLPFLGEPKLVQVGVGRFAVYADTATIRREAPEAAWIRSLQVAEEGFAVGEATYVGGWSRWAFDCGARMADRLDFASVKSDLTEGPSMPDAAPPYAATSGSDELELLLKACIGVPDPAGLSLEQAIREGQAALAD